MNDGHDELDYPSPMSGRVVSYTVRILSTVKKLQQLHGLRHGDYQRYRSYCTRRIRRLRKSLHLPQGDRRHFKKRPVTVSNVTDVRVAHIPIMLAERAWSYAMQLRLEANTEHRKKFHVISRLRKAVQHASELYELCKSGIFSIRTLLEAEAYVCWMSGTLYFELKAWKEAVEQLKTAQVIYEKLESAYPNEEEDVFFYKQRQEELTTSIRYCVYNMGDDTAIENLLELRQQAHGDLLKNIDILAAQVKDSTASRFSETQWLGKRILVKSEKVKMFLISDRDLESTFDRNTLAQNIDLLEQHLMDCKDAVTLVQEEISSEQAPNKVSHLQHLLSYLTFIKLNRTMQRNLFLAESAKKTLLSPFDKGKKSAEDSKSNPRYMSRLYELTLQHLSEMEQIPGLKDDARYGDILEMKNLAFTAFRCYYVGMELFGLHHWNMAVAIYDEALKHATEALKFENVDTKLKEQVEQLVTKINNDKYTTIAYSVLGDSGQLTADKSPKKSPFNKLSPLGDVTSLLKDQNSTGAACPNLKPVPFKPLFFDLAQDKVRLPSLKDKTQEKKPVVGAALSGLVKGMWGWGSSKN